MLETNRQPEELLRALLSGPDADFESIVAPDARLRPLMNLRGYVGPNGARQNYADAAAQGMQLRAVLERVAVKGDGALGHGKLHVIHDTREDVHTVVWGARVRDGLVTDFQAFLDPEEAEAWLRGSAG